MSDMIKTSQLAMRSSLPQVKHWFPLFHIWAVHWVASGLIKWIGEWRFPFPVQLLVTALAVAISAGFVLSGGSWRRSRAAAGPIEAADSSDAALSAASGLPCSRQAFARIIALPLLVVAGSAGLLLYAQAAHPFFMDLLRSLMLSLFYVILGRLLGRHLVYVGLWLFALCAVSAIWYLGFAPLVLEGIGGFSLAVCGWMITRWSREAENNRTAH